MIPETEQMIGVRLAPRVIPAPGVLTVDDQHLNLGTTLAGLDGLKWAWNQTEYFRLGFH